MGIESPPRSPVLPASVTGHSLPPHRLLRRADQTHEHESCRHRTTRTARGPDAAGTARAEAEAGLGADPGPRLRAQPLRAVHSARPFALGHLPACSRDRGGGRNRGRSGHRVVAGPDCRHGHGRYGPTVRRFLRRVHLRSGRAGANSRHDARLADARCASRDDPDRLGLPAQLSPGAFRPDPPHSRWHDLRGTGGGGPGAETRCHCRSDESSPGT